MGKCKTNTHLRTSLRSASLAAAIGVLGLSSFSAFAEISTSLSQRVGITKSKGQLSRDELHPSFMFALTQSFLGSQNRARMSITHQFTLLYDTFYSRAADTLAFPVGAERQVNLIEPGFAVEACPFSSFSVYPCLSAGLSNIYIKTDSQNYQTYGSFPYQFRFVYIAQEPALFFEIGARYRMFNNRVAGVDAKQEDIFGFIGFGLNFSGR